MRAQASSAGSVPFATSRTGAPLTGFTAVPGSFSGSGSIDTFDLPFVWGNAFDLEFGVLASAHPVTNFTLVSGSGTPNDANGVHPVPEPSTSALILVGLAAVAAAGNRSGVR